MSRAAAICLALICASACGADDSGAEAGVGGSREGCEEPGSHSYAVSKHSCACEDGYTWCSAALDDFDCCPLEASEDEDTGESAVAPELPCDADSAEQLACVEDPAAPTDPRGSVVWACNGERWVEVPGYSTFACLAAGYPFAYGCAADDPEPSFLCGFGPGSMCEPAQYPAVCIDEDIIDTCLWGLRTVDRCSRLCAELEAFGSGFSGGACVQSQPETPATCECCVTC